MNLYRSRISRAEEEEGNGIYEQYEKDYDLGDLGPRGLFKEYLEMSKIFFFYHEVKACWAWVVGY